MLFRSVLHLIAERKRWRVLLHTETNAATLWSRPATLELVDKHDRADVIARKDLDGITLKQAAGEIVEGLTKAGLVP